MVAIWHHIIVSFKVLAQKVFIGSWISWLKCISERLTVAKSIFWWVDVICMGCEGRAYREAQCTGVMWLNKAIWLLDGPCAPYYGDNTHALSGISLCWVLIIAAHLKSAIKGAFNGELHLQQHYHIPTSSLLIAVCAWCTPLGIASIAHFTAKSMLVVFLPPLSMPLL